MLDGACFVLGRGDDGYEWAARARQISVERGERGREAWTRWLLGEIEAQRNPGSTNQSPAHYAQPWPVLGTEFGMCPSWRAAI